MGLLTLIPGLILLLVNADWFSGQQTVGWVLTIVGTILLAAQVAIVWAAASAARRF
jgi:hypothetical protein